MLLNIYPQQHVVCVLPGLLGLLHWDREWGGGTFFSWNFPLVSELCSFPEEELTFLIPPECHPVLPHFSSLHVEGLKGSRLGCFFSIVQKKPVHSSQMWVFISDLFRFHFRTLPFWVLRWSSAHFISVFVLHRKHFGSLGLKAFHSYLCGIVPSSNYALSSLLKIEASLFLWTVNTNPW